MDLITQHAAGYEVADRIEFLEELAGAITEEVSELQEEAAAV